MQALTTTHINTMRLKLLLITMFCGASLFAQVGIGTTTPKSALQIVASNATAPKNTDGILIPSIDNFPTINPTIDQDGMLVFLKTATAPASTFGSNAIGFYYWSNPLTTWVSVSPKNAWLLTGNTATVDGVNYIGTNDNVPLNFKVNSQKAGRLSTTQSFYGYLAGNLNASTNNTAIGAEALSKYTGASNTAIGYQALKEATTSPNNTAIGYQALSSVISGGGSNVAIGNEALKNNITDSNTAIGFRTLLNTTSGFSNTAIGREALTTNTTGIENTAVGRESMRNNTTGQENTAVGRESLRANTTGFSNTAVGKNALATNTTGQENTAVGKVALLNNLIGEKNTAIGTESLNSNTSGVRNTGIGFAAIYDNNSGSRNVGVGYEALRNTKNSFNTAIGYTSMYSNNTGEYNTAIGYNTFSGNTTGSNNTAIGRDALNTNTTGSNNTAIGYNADVVSSALTNATAIGYNAIADNSNMVRIGNAAVTSIKAQVGITITSDSRFKDNIKNIPLGLEFISSLRPVEYTRKNDASKRKEWGVIAQELKATIEKSNYENAGIVSEDASKDHFLSVRYTDLIAPMIKAIQELDEKEKKIEVLENKIENQEKVLNDLVKRIEALEK